MELSNIYVDKTHWLCKMVNFAPLPPMYYRIVDYDEEKGYKLKASKEEDYDPLDPDRPWINDEL